MVKEGKLLFEIDPRPYKAALDAAEAQEKAAEASLRVRQDGVRPRQEAGRRAGAASREELDVWTAKQARRQGRRLKAQAAVEPGQARPRLHQGHRAHRRARSAGRRSPMGNLVNAGGGETLLTTIVSVDPMYVYFDVDERALLRYRSGLPQGSKDARRRRAVRSRT